MVISNKQRQIANRLAAKKKRLTRKAKPTSQPAVSKPKKKPKKKVKKKAKKKAKRPTKADNAKLVSELKLPTRAINALEAEGLLTKGDVRQYLKDHQSAQEVPGIGETWAKLIKKLVK